MARVVPGFSIGNWRLKQIRCGTWRSLCIEPNGDTPEQQALAKALWLDALDIHDNANVDAILESYIFLERWKSVLVDVVRYPREIRETALLPDVIEERAHSLSHKLRALSVHMPCRTFTTPQITDLLTAWAGRG